MLRCFLTIAICLFAAGAAAQTLYKYKDDQGHWQFSDRPPAENQSQAAVEKKTLSRDLIRPTVTLERRRTQDSVEIVAYNGFYSPVELAMKLDGLSNVVAETPSQKVMVLRPNSTTTVLEIKPSRPNQQMAFEIAYQYLPGDPEAQHKPEEPYRVPFAVGTEFTISQAFPLRVTHNDAASFHAIDVAVPVGTALYAARAGVIIEIAYDSYTGGTDAKDLPKANVVRILHNDGTIAVYAHLSWNSIRVRPGQRVERGEYIADSGNTGFSSGPHLHFAVQRNTGLKLASVPVSFQGGSGATVKPVVGRTLIARP